MLTEYIKKQLVDRIMASEKIDKILLFGSEATGDSGPESDIDLLIILDQETLPLSFKERSANYLLINRAIRDVEKHYPIALLVYTKPEFEMIKAGGNP